LEALQPAVIAGAPLSFTALLEIAPALQPAVLISTSMTCCRACARAWSKYFGCPVLDVYSMNVAGPLAVFDPGVDEHVLRRPRLYVEILDADE
jgi:phenylacetate-CoA ligase